MLQETFEKKIRARFEDRGLFVRRCLHPNDFRSIRLGRKPPLGEKRFPYCIFRRSQNGAVNMIWIVEWRDGTPKPLMDSEIEFMSRCDNYRYWRNRVPNKWDLDRMDRYLFNVEEEDRLKAKRKAEWRDYRRREIMPVFRHDLMKNSIIRTESKTFNPMRTSPRRPRQKGKIIYSGGG